MELLLVESWSGTGSIIVDVCLEVWTDRASEVISNARCMSLKW